MVTKKARVVTPKKSTVPELTPEMLEAGRDVLSVWHRFDTEIVTDAEAIKEIWAAIWQHAAPSSNNAGRAKHRGRNAKVLHDT